MQKLSVLMTVYAKDDPEYLREAMESVYRQTVQADEVVLVCDGPVTDALDQVIGQMQEKFGQRLQVVRLEKNVGLGNALNKGLTYCSHELVARMDSDDISTDDRFERQMALFEDDPDLGVVSGTVLEFFDAPEKVVGERKLPADHEEIVRYSRRRNPFNHPAVMFRKSCAETAGGYSEEFPLFEDYYLWVRMLRSGARSMNIPEPVLHMRMSADSYRRRGGVRYAQTLLRFYSWMCSVGWSGGGDFMLSAVPHAIVCVMPNGVRRGVYKILHHDLGDVAAVDSV